MKKDLRFLLLGVVFVLLWACVSGPPNFDKIPRDLGVVKPVVMFGEKASDKHDSAKLQFDKPKSIGVQSNGNIIVGGKHFDLTMFTADGQFVKIIGKKGKGEGEWLYTKGIAIADNDDIYVADAKQNKIIVYDKDGNFKREFGKEGTGPGEFSDIGPICIDSDYNLYVSDANAGIIKFDANDKFIMNIGHLGEGKGLIADPGWVAVNSRLKKLYIADDPNGQVDVYNAETGDFLYEFGGIGEGPDKWAEDVEGLAIGPWDLVFAVDEAGGNIKIFKEDGTFITKFGKPGIYDGELADSEGIAYDKKNRRIVLADEKNFRVQSWSLKSLGF